MPTRFVAVLCLTLTNGACGPAPTEVHPHLPPPPPPPAIPRSQVTIEGKPYDAYQDPAETFRIVCQAPCAIDEATIFAKYAGMREAKHRLVDTAGIDALPQLQPVDVHLAADDACGPFRDSVAGDAGTYASDGRARLCLFEVENGTRPPPYVPDPLVPETAVMLDHQVLFVHEYTHALFFERHFTSWEDVARSLSYIVTGLYSDLCDPFLDQIGGHLTYLLCKEDRLTLAQLKESLIALDALYQAGKGEVTNHGAPAPTSIAQWRFILDGITGKRTAKAFIEAGVRYAEAGDEITLTPAGGTFSLYDGRVRFDLPADAVAAPVTLAARATTDVDHPHTTLSLATAESFAPANTSFAKPVRLTMSYDPKELFDGAEADLAIVGPTARDAQVDTQKHTVTATIDGLGIFRVDIP